MSVVVISAIYGAYDEVVEPPPQTIDAEWYMVHEGKLEVSPDSIWTPIVDCTHAATHPRLQAKWPKCMPWAYKGADVWVWLDGSVQLKDETSLEKLLWWSNGSPMAQFAHPDRDCIYDEVEASLPMEKYQGIPLHLQANHYRKNGHPPNWGLWATGVIIYNQVMHPFGQQWLIEQMHWGYHDQISEAPVLRHFGLRPHTMTEYLWDNPALAWRSHLRED